MNSHYLAEKRDTVTGKWEKVAEVPRGTTCAVGKLLEGHAYDFRVCAVSKEGQSEYLETEVATIAKNPYGEYDSLFSLEAYFKMIDGFKLLLCITWLLSGTLLNRILRKNNLVI